MNLFSNKKQLYFFRTGLPKLLTGLIYTNWIATLHWEGLRRAVHLTLQREEQLSGWTLGRRESTFWRENRHSEREIGHSGGRINTMRKNQHSIGGSTLRKEYGNFGGRISTPREGRSTLGKNDQHFGDRINHNVWSNVISWVTTFLNSRSWTDQLPSVYLFYWCCC